MLAGGGSVVSMASTVTGAAGTIAAKVRLGAAPGQNALRADVTNGATRPGGTGFVEGTVPPDSSAYLASNFLDPSAGGTLRIRVMVPSPQRVTIRIYNLAGELVRKVAQADVMPGLQQWDWDGKNQSGEPVSVGTYLIQIVAGRETTIRKVIVNKSR